MPIILLLFSFFGAFLLSLGWLFLHRKGKSKVLPNHRSSHQRPTPQGGGLSVAIVAVLTLLFLSMDWPVSEQLLAVFPFTLATLTGYWDDFHDLSGHWKLILVMLGVLPLVLIPTLFYTNLLLPFSAVLAMLGPGAVGLFALILLLGLTWVVNLTNFMDGIDGLAVLQVMFMMIVLFFFRDDFTLTPIVIDWLICLWFACLAFLPFNFPRARLFLGDTGSLFLGTIIAWLLVLMTLSHSNGLWVFLCLFAIFWVDTTLTLIRRLWRKKSIFTAHREHAYQHLANEKWHSHTKTVMFLMAINIFWLFPMSYLVLSSVYPLFWLGLALIPVGAYCLWMKAGSQVNYEEKN